MSAGAFADPARWAWEFLRRCPEYRADYAAFMADWRALEAAYGAPPRRDMARWIADPRATRPAWDPDDPSCAVSDERQAIECWMGAKWGFFQFPPNPDQATPPTWRPVPMTVTEVDRAPGGTTVTLAFDLSLPIPPQLDAARTLLASRVAGLRRTGQRVTKSAQDHAARWQAWLDILDAANPAHPDWSEAAAMCRAGYRGILRLLG